MTRGTSQRAVRGEAPERLRSARAAVRTMVVAGLVVAVGPSAGSAVGSTDRRGEKPDLVVSHRVVVYGRTVLLSGRATALPGARMTLLRRRFGATTFTPVALVGRGGAGTWSYRARPQVRTAWVVEGNGARSDPVVVEVRPRIRFAEARGRFVIEVAAARALDGRYVVLEQRRGLRWRAVRRIRLARPAVRVRIQLARGTRARVVLPRPQAGPGYLAGISPPLVVGERPGVRSR